jgi:hypothetical protein
MTSRLLRALCVLVAFSIVIAPVAGQNNSVNRTSPYVQITLKQQLEQGLKCRRPVEFQFVDHVADLVDEGTLPINLVNICFDWSRKKNSFRPFVYFQQSLTMLAQQQGISL